MPVKSTTDFDQFRKEFAPLLRAINSRVKGGIISLFHRNPYLIDRAEGLAHRLGDDRIPLFSRALSQLEKAGFLASRIGGVTVQKVYYYEPAGDLKERIARFFQVMEENGFDLPLQRYLAAVEKKRRKAMTFALIGGALILIGGLLLAGIGTFRHTERERLKEELAQDVPSEGPGIREEHYPSGKLRSRTEYFSGVKNGKHTSWFENGQLMLEGEYESDRQHGSWIYYNEQGGKIFEVVYDHGEVTTRREF